MCKGTDCPMKESCYRFTAIPDEFWQSYFTEVPLSDDDKCTYYYHN